MSAATVTRQWADFMIGWFAEHRRCLGRPVSQWRGVDPEGWCALLAEADRLAGDPTSRDQLLILAGMFGEEYFAGAQAENKRIRGILALHGPASVKQQAIQAGLTVEATAAALNTRASSFGALRAGDPLRRPGAEA